MWVRETLDTDGKLITHRFPDESDGERAYFRASDRWQLLVDRPKLIVAVGRDGVRHFSGQLVVYHEEEGEL